MINKAVDTYDVVVAGGGSAGVAAAVASARCGARTLLVERNHCLGGAATMRNVNTYCGLYTLGEQPELVVKGIAEEVINGLKSRGAITEPLRHRGVYVVFDPESVKIVLDRISNCNGLDCVYGGVVIEAENGTDDVHSVTIADGGGVRTLNAKVLVDCTGDGALLSAIGANTRYGNNGEVNLATLGTRFGGIPNSVTIDASQIAAAVQRAASSSGRTLENLGITKDRSVIVRLPLSGDVLCYLASEDYDPRDVASHTRADRSGREQAWRYLDIIKTIPGCENAYLVSTGPEFGTRESLHLVAKKQLTWKEVKQRTTFDDCIAFGAWGAEWHDRSNHVSTFEYPADKNAYQIPLSCLRSNNIDKLYAAGRLADGDRLAGASIRVMGTAFATGQAVGIAAALDADTGNALYDDVKRKLLEQGAVLPSNRSI